MYIYLHICIFIIQTQTTVELLLKTIRLICYCAFSYYCMDFGYIIYNASDYFNCQYVIAKAFIHIIKLSEFTLLLHI